MRIGERFGNRLRELRKQSGMKQNTLATKFGLHRSYVSELECGTKNPSLEVLEIVAVGFGITISELLKDI